MNKGKHSFSFNKYKSQVLKRNDENLCGDISLVPVTLSKFFFRHSVSFPLPEKKRNKKDKYKILNK